MNNQEKIYLQKFSEWLIIKGHTRATAMSYTKAAEQFTLWLEKENIETENAGYNDILAYINHQKKKGNKPQTIQLAVNAIKHYYNFLQSEEVVSENPCSHVEIKGIKRKTLY